jgi:hypothetical protein
MSLKTNEILIDCDHCRCTAIGSTNSFNVTVPICDIKTGNSDEATLHCVISENKHKVNLKEWHNATIDSMDSSDNLQQRLAEALEYVAKHQICGNRSICPSEVVQVVKKLSNR